MPYCKAEACCKWEAAAHLPPMIYCKMDNIVSPTGAEAEGWLITVGGTPK